MGFADEAFMGLSSVASIGIGHFATTLPMLFRTPRWEPAVGVPALSAIMPILDGQFHLEKPLTPGVAWCLSDPFLREMGDSIKLRTAASLANRTEANQERYFHESG
jgi:hypothetical protein